MRILALLFGLRAPVRRGAYLAFGLGLAALKFVIDTGIVYAFTGRTWSPLGYVIPSLVIREDAVGHGPEAMMVVLPLVALPFLWIGLSMSVRRAVDAGISPWLGTLFMVPLVNYFTIAVLCVLPSTGSAASLTWAPPAQPVYRQIPLDPPPPTGVTLPDGVRAALLGVVASAAIGVSMLGLCVYGLGVYGSTLFFVTPFAMGATSAVVYNRGRARGLGATLLVAMASLLVAGSVPLLFALEGLLCLAMALPIACAIAFIGASLAWAIMSMGRGQPALPALLVLVVPGSAVGEAGVARPLLRDVTTSIEIDAPPERVWPNVVGFSELREPPQWFFRLGVAYPKSARIAGEGVGAVRRCEFSTGAFVEPITAWAPPSRLAFDVASQPPSMTEWSPYRTVRAPHIEGYMLSKGGEFDLTPLPGGRTRLEGTTHYTLAIYPETYWRPFAEGLLHAIHRRVLMHIKDLAEAPTGR